MLQISKKSNSAATSHFRRAGSGDPQGVSNGKADLWIVVGLILLPLAADMLVDNAVVIAKFLG